MSRRLFLERNARENDVRTGKWGCKPPKHRMPGSDITSWDYIDLPGRKDSEVCLLEPKDKML
jgi:hypothetical protein